MAVLTIALFDVDTERIYLRKEAHDVSSVVQTCKWPDGVENCTDTGS